MAWVDWNISQLSSGYMYCCTVEEAAKAIHAIPSIYSAGLIQLETVPVVPTKEPVKGDHTCTAGPCTCSCPVNGKGTYTCTCTCIV